MNMISTGSFLTETGASNKQSELVKKLTAAWEKKNSKTARAGGASLMALSLAACGGEDTTPFDQADVDAAVAAAEAPLQEAVAAAEAAQAAAEADAAEALVAQAAAEADAAEALVAQAAAEADAAAALVAQAAAEADAAAALVAQSAAEADAAAATVAAAEATAAKEAAEAAQATAEAALATAQADLTAKTAEYDALVASNATLQSQYDALVAPVNQTLTTAATDVVNGRTGNDTITATNLTLNAGDIITDSSSTDSDAMTITVDNADLAATAIVAGIETVTVNITSVLAGTTNALDLSVDLANYSGLNTVNVNATNASTLVNSLTLNNADSATINADTEFQTVTINTDDNASIVANVAEDLTVESTGTVTNLTATTSATTGTATISTDADGIVDITTAGDTNVTANAAASVTVTSAGDATVGASATTANAVTVTAGERALVTANNAETVTISAGDGIDAAQATALDSTLSSSNTNNITVNVSGNGAATVLDVTGAATVNNVAISGDQDVTIEMSMASIDSLGSTTSATADDNIVTISDASTGTSTLSFITTGGDVDVSSAAVDVINVAAALGANDDITIDSGRTVTVSADQTQDLSLVAKVATATDNSVSITAANDVTDVDDLAGITLTNFATATVTAADASAAAALGAITASGTSVTIEGGAFGFNSVGAINLGTGVLTINGAAAFDMSTQNITAGSVQAGNATGVITIDLNGLATTGTVVTGSGDDDITTSGAARTSGDYVITTGAGNDLIKIGIVDGYTIDMGAGLADRIDLVAGADYDLSAQTVSFAGVETIDLNDENLTLSAAAFATDNIFSLVDTAGGDTGTLTVTGTANADNVDARNVVVDANSALVINGGASGDTLTGAATATTINGGDGNDTITGGAGGDTLNGNDGNDTIVTGNGTNAANGGAGNDTITGGTGVDTITGGAGADTMTGGAGSDVYVVNTGEVVAGESIVEAATATADTDTIRADSATDLSAMTAASLDNIEAINMDVDLAHVTLTGAQATGETINIIGSGGGSTDNLTINMGIGETGVFTNVAVGGATGAAIIINGASGAEDITVSSSGVTVTAGAGDDTITLGAGNDDVVFGNKTTNGNDTVELFTTNATATGADGDDINLTGTLDGGTLVSDLDGAGTNDDADLDIVVLDATGDTNPTGYTALDDMIVKVINTGGTIAAADVVISTSAADGKLEIANDSEFIAAVAAATTSTSFNLYHVVDTDSTAAVTASVTLLGTVELASAETFADVAAADFILA